MFFLIFASLFCNEQASVIPKRMAGIFGGMGPEATANLYQLVVSLTPAKKDQEHIPTIIFSFPQVPDRTTAIINNNRAIIPYLVQGVQLLEKSGASFIAIPCNTAHYFYDEMQSAVNIPIIHMIRETVTEVIRINPMVKKIGILATNGTIQTGLYESEFKKKGIKVLMPDASVQKDCVMEAIAGIKAGIEKKRCTDLLAVAGRQLEEKGAEIIVLGCTEIPLAFDEKCVAVPVVNATRVLAKAIIHFYSKLGNDT